MDDQKELTPEEVLSGKKAESKSVEELLFPPLPADYFKDCEGVSFDNRSPIEKAVDAYNNAAVKPYVKYRKLGGSDTEFDDGSGRHSAWEIGLNFSF